MAVKISLLVTGIFVVVIGSLAEHKDTQCKFPPQWQSTVFLDYGMLIYGVAGHARASGTFYYDYPNRRMRIDLKGTEQAPDKQNFTVSFMRHFNEQASYYIDYDAKFCEITYGIDPVWNSVEGVPASSVAYTFGDLGGFKKIVGQYILVINDGPTYPGVRVVMDVNIEEVCPPFRVMFQNLSDDPEVMYQYEFVDHTDLKNPDVFKTPDNCTNSTLTMRKLSSLKPLGFFMI